MMDAQDNISREKSTDPAVHRELVVVDPPMEGRDVANLQRGIEERLNARGIDIPTPTHGKFTHATAVGGVEAGYVIGLMADTYLRVVTKPGGDRRLVSTEGAQTLIRNPDRRSDEQLDRARDRHAQTLRGPRYYDEMSTKVLGRRGQGAQAALAFAQAQVGTVEHPAGSNWGPKISGWCQLAGYVTPVPWCGCFANAACMAGGVQSGAGWLIGYTPAIVSHAQRGLDGWSWHKEGRPGDLALFDSPGGDPAIHVEVTKRVLGPGRYNTIGGNTSRQGASGSMSNGGGVFEHTDRMVYAAGRTFYIIGFARPPFQS